MNQGLTINELIGHTINVLSRVCGEKITLAEAIKFQNELSESFSPENINEKNITEEDKNGQTKKY